MSNTEAVRIRQEPRNRRESDTGGAACCGHSSASIRNHGCRLWLRSCWWGGLRGALAPALALALLPSLVFHNEIIIATFGVVVFSVVVQGLTVPPLLRALALLPKRPRKPAPAR